MNENVAESSPIEAGRPPVVIKPTVGRVVWYWPGGRSQKMTEGAQPYAAQIACVHSDVCVTIGYLDSGGTARNATSVQLIQEGEIEPEHGFCEWMPYQKGQAARTEQIENAMRRGAG